MDKDTFFYGEALKKIRENKNYTQKEIANHTMSRSNYSKMEKDQVNPNVEKYFAILDFLDINHEEFTFILNDYQLNDKQTIIYTFKEMDQTPSTAYVKDLIQSCEELLNDREDHITRDIYNIALGYYFLLEERNTEESKIHAAKVWERLKELDKYYLSEYHLLNGILYFFELETAVSITDKALEELELYYPFKEADTLHDSFSLNISALLISHNQEKIALQYIDKLIAKSKENNNIVTLGAAYVRKGVCLELTDNQKEAQNMYERAKELFNVINRDDLIKKMEDEPQSVCNPYFY